MSYVNRVLQPGETVVYVTTYHWLIYRWAVLFAVVTVLLFLFAGSFNDERIAIVLKVSALVFLLFAAIAWASAFIRRRCTELAVTDRRVIYKTGLIRRYTIEINRSKVETVGVDQSVWGRLIGFGTIIVRGTGGSFEPIPCIGHPLTFRNHITAG